MRILHVLSQLPDQTGSGIYLQSLAQQAAQAGHRQSVVAAANEGQQVEIPWLTAGDLTLVRFNGPDLPFALPGMSDLMPYPSSRFSGLGEEQLGLYTSVFEATLREARRVRDPQVVHCNHLWLVTAAARRVFSDRPVVASCHGTDLRQVQLCPHLAPRVIPACRELDRVFALTSSQAEEIHRVCGVPEQRIEVTGGAINTHLFGLPPRSRSGEFQAVSGALALDIPRTGLRVAYVGKLARAKGVESLMDAVMLLHRRGQRGFSLLLVGTGAGDEGRDIEQRAAGIGPPVYLLGHRKQQAVADLLRSCHVFVLPSFFEGLPLSVLEALVSGCRVVVSDLPSLRGWPEEGLVEEGVIERVSLPPMKGVDRPDPAGLRGFAARLADALALQLERSRTTPLSRNVLRLSGALSWDALFRRIERVYRQLAGPS